MTTDNTTRLIDYLEGKLTAEEVQALEKELAASPQLRAELEGLRRLITDLNSVEEQQPSPALSDRFYRFLEQEQGHRPVSRRRFARFDWMVAAAVALLVIGIGFGVLWQRNLRQEAQINALVAEVQTTRKMMVLSMLDQQSASQRLKAVSTARQQVDDPDPQIIRALIDVLDTDDNVNVRMKAAEALLEFAGSPGVIEALIRSLRRQDSPEVQIALIDVLVAGKAKGAVPELQRLLRQDDLMEVVKNKAAAGIGQLM